MDSEKMAGLSPEEREMLEGATVEGSEADKEAVKYTPEQQMVISAFEAAANKNDAYRKILDRYIAKQRDENIDIFTGRGDIFEQAMNLAETLKKSGMAEDDIAKKLEAQASKVFDKLETTELGRAA